MYKPATELSAQSSNGLDLSQDPLVQVPIPPGLDRVALTGGSAVPGDDDMTKTQQPRCAREIIHYIIYA